VTLYFDKLFNPDNIPLFTIYCTPVITPFSRKGFPFKADSNSSLNNSDTALASLSLNSK
jgi:hypothetical protein